MFFIMSFRRGFLGVILLSSIGTLLGCGISEKDNSSNINSIIGTDNRKPLSSSEIRKKIGTINYEGTPICTVFASGINQITTAAHCVDGNKINNYSVVIDGMVLPINGLKSYNNADISVLNVEHVSEYFDSATFSPSTSTSLASYGIDKKDFIFSNVGKAILNTNGIIRHNYDTLPGASGAPLLQNNKVVGVHLGTSTENGVTYNLAVNYIKYAQITLVNINYQAECHSLNPFCGGGVFDAGQSSISICGVNMTIPTLSYAICASSAYLLPAGCTIGSAISAGGLCLTNVAIVSGACGVSVAKVTEIAYSCIKAK